MAVQVMADDYGRDPIAGTLVASSADEIAIRREDPRVGEVVVHFPAQASGCCPPRCARTVRYSGLSITLH